MSENFAVLPSLLQRVLKQTNVCRHFSGEDRCYLLDREMLLVMSSTRVGFLCKYSVFLDCSERLVLCFSTS